ncbi:PAS domain-containing protein [Iodobacter sp. HSC-16F04]|uniref:histidine kinase n=1 Tax=Iodobacter violaceini TaxID=3044271 RepID=A0ABX0KL27_9NEIS|nr:PAS domain-containing protein [Iodobacter violacea]NHQ84830.1 PAS domain-containing protein [Iodobacter violacea]
MHLLLPEDIQEIFPLLLENVPTGVAVLDRGLRQLCINSRHASVNHMSVADHLGKRLEEFLPQAAMVIEPKLQFVLDTGKPLVKQEIRGKAGVDGHTVHRMASYYPWKGQAGDIRGVLAIIQDSTLDNVAEQLLQNSQHKLLKVLDNLFSFVGVLELDGTLSEANLAPLLAAGLSIDDVRGKKFWDCYWWSYDEAIQARLIDAISRCRQGETVRYDVPVRMKNNSRMWIDFMLAPLRDEEGNITHLIPSGMDITQRHQSEAALHLSEERYFSVIESSDDAIITKSLDGIILSWNSAAERLLGYAAAEAIGMSVSRLFPPGQLSEEASILQRIASGERVPSFETARIHKNGSEVQVSVTISPLRDRQGVVVGACKLARDISAQKRQREDLQHALDEKTALLHEVHHRVKNNLQIVSSLLNLQARKVPPEAMPAIAECQGRISAMALVHQLLYESDHLSDVNLADFLSRLVFLMEAIYGVAESKIKLVFLGAEPEATLDVTRIIPFGLVINELVLNAIKHAFPTEKSGLIEVGLKLLPDQQLQLLVRDNGCGLPAQFSWDQKTGLGSQLIPMFVNQLQGRLLTESSPAGASFILLINEYKAQRDG